MQVLRHAAAVGQRRHVNWRLTSDTCALFVCSAGSGVGLGMLRYVSMDTGLPVSDALSLGE